MRVVMVPRARIELATQGFSVLRSTTELPRLKSLHIIAKNIKIRKCLVKKLALS